MSLEEFKDACRKAAVHWWAYAELVDDAEAQVEAAWEAKEDPSEFIKELGKELDLHEFGPAWGSW